MLHLQGVELARSTRCFSPEGIYGKVPGTPDFALSLAELTHLVIQKHHPKSGQMEAKLTCSMCQEDLQDLGARLLPCQHVFCKTCLQGLIQELGQVAKDLETVPDGKYKNTISSSLSI